MGKYIIIGGDAAGMSAAMQIRREDKNAEIWAFEMGETFSYAQCGLPYFIEGLVSSENHLVARTEKEFQERYNINALSRHQVTKIDPAEKKVEVNNLRTDESTEYSYDKLLIATGASPIKPDWLGIELEGVFFLKTMEDAQKIKWFLEQNSVKKVVIIGGGYIGLEMSEAFIEQNIDVTIIEKTNQIGTGLDFDMSEHVIRYVSKHLQLRLGEEVKEIGKTSGEESPVTVKTDKDTYQADLVLVAIGVIPNSQLAREAGIETGVKGAIQVNAKMETSIPDIYAAGDCAVQFHRIKNKDDYIPLGTHANKQGRIAGSNMSGGSNLFAGVAGTSIFKVKDLHIARTGLGEKEAEDAGLVFDTVMIKSYQHARYFPGAKQIFVKLLYTREQQKLIGGQIIGYDGVDKQVDLLATALYHGMTLDQIQELDLAYAPPFSSVWSPIQQAAAVGKKKKG